MDHISSKSLLFSGDVSVELFFFSVLEQQGLSSFPEMHAPSIPITLSANETKSPVKVVSVTH